MAKASQELIQALRETARRVETGAPYQWGHMAHCNCGHLAQTVTERTGQELAETVNGQLDEWTEHAKAYCGVSGTPVDDLLKALQDLGFYKQDVIYLEKLSDPQVLERLGAGTQLRRNHRSDYVLYLKTLADLMEESFCTETSNAFAGN